MPDLERALQIAVQAHAGQKDKNGVAYIFHPIRVMMRCVTPKAKMAAILHDVVEDTDVTFEQLKSEGFSEDVLNTLRLLTHEEDVSYEDYIERIAADRTAIEVKLADLEDNSDIRRLCEMDAKAQARLLKYHKAWKRLSSEREKEMAP